MKMNWYYFRRVLGGGLVLVPRCEMPSRPSCARDGDEYTPWYREDDHFDDEHVHVRGINVVDGYDRAYNLIKRV